MAGKPQGRTIEVHCENCGKKKTIFKSHYEKSKSEKFYCDDKCRSEYGWVNLECDTCSKAIRRKKSKMNIFNFCSNTCARAHVHFRPPITHEVRLEIIKHSGTIAQIAEEFEIGEATVNNIRQGREW